MVDISKYKHIKPTGVLTPYKNNRSEKIKWHNRVKDIEDSIVIYKMIRLREQP